MEEITKITEDRVYVNFNFNKEGEADSKRSFVESVVMCSAELDYAILRMQKPHEQLPPCIFSHGISIMKPAWPESNGSVLEDVIGYCVDLMNKMRRVLISVRRNKLTSLTS